MADPTDEEVERVAKIVADEEARLTKFDGVGDFEKMRHEKTWEGMDEAGRDVTRWFVRRNWKRLQRWLNETR
jgi:hypothetical protein